MVIPTVHERYRKAKREALESILYGEVTIYNEVEYTDPDTHLSDYKKMAIIQNEPCRINNQGSSPTTDDEPAQLSKNINVRLKPELKIKAGSTFVITQHGFKREYEQSGEAKHYIDHQIIPLTLKEYA